MCTCGKLGYPPHYCWNSSKETLRVTHGRPKNDLRLRMSLQCLTAELTPMLICYDVLNSYITRERLLNEDKPVFDTGNSIPGSSLLLPITQPSNKPSYYLSAYAVVRSVKKKCLAVSNCRSVLLFLSLECDFFVLFCCCFRKEWQVIRAPEDPMERRVTWATWVSLVTGDFPDRMGRQANRANQANRDILANL